MDSYSREYHKDDESSLGSYDVDAEIDVAEELQAIETSLSNYEPSVEDVEEERESHQMPLKDLHRLVGIVSEEEVDASMPDMPAYKIR